MDEKKNRWEAFANDDAEYYVDTSLLRLPKGERKEKFFKHGRDFTVETFAKVETLLPDTERALEIGAGVGRMALPHARLFQEVIAVDIAPTMLEKLRKNAKDMDRENIRTFLAYKPWHQFPVSYAYSYFVFQHIVDFSVIERYLQRIAGCLKEGGIAQLHFDTRQESILYKLRSSIPDFLLPRTQRKGIRRVRREASDLRNLFKKYNLKIIKERAPDTLNTFFILRK